MAKVNKRIGATRKPVRKQRQAINWQQWLRILILTPVVIGLAMFTFWLQQEDSLPILHVTVDGEFEHADREQLVSAVTPYVTGSFIHVNVDKLREAGEALPWVKQIQVQRKWPDSLHLIVEEQQAIAYWGNRALVSQSGELFSPKASSFPQGLALLQGPDGMSKVLLGKYMEATRQLAEVTLTIDELTMDKRRAWTIILNDGIKVKLGRANGVERLTRFINVYKAGLAQYTSQIKIVDMRYTNGLSVVWKSGQQPEFNGAV